MDMRGVVGTVGLFLVSSCSGAEMEDGDGPLPPRIIGIGEGAFRTATLGDWASQAEQLSAITVVSEAEIPPPREVIERREGYIGRRVTVRIDENIWTKPGTVAHTGTMEWNAAGWILKGDMKIPFYLQRSPRLEVGGRYIGPFLRYMGGWSPLGTETIFPAWGDAIATADVHVVGQMALAAGLTGKSADELRREMEAAGQP